MLLVSSIAAHHQPPAPLHSLCITTITSFSFDLSSTFSARLPKITCLFPLTFSPCSLPICPQHVTNFLSASLLLFCPFAQNMLYISSPCATSQHLVVDVIIVGESAGDWILSNRARLTGLLSAALTKLSSTKNIG